MRTLIIFFGSVAGIYLLSLLTLFISGRKTDARAIGGFIPDCIILFKSLVNDSAVPKRYKIMLLLTLGTLISPVDLIPDFLPVVGQLDDAVLVLLALRYIVRHIGSATAIRHWPGPDASLKVLLKLASLKHK